MQRYSPKEFMSRRIICKSCRDKTGPQHPEDVADGWKRRIVEIKAKKPEQHEIVTLCGGVESHEALSSLYCDNCGIPIANGETAYAVTMWRGEEIGDWEQDYSMP